MNKARAEEPTDVDVVLEVFFTFFNWSVVDTWQNLLGANWAGFWFSFSAFTILFGAIAYPLVDLLQGHNTWWPFVVMTIVYCALSALRLLASFAPSEA